MSNTPKDFKGWFGAQNHQSKPPSKSGKPPPIPETHTPPKPKSKLCPAHHQPMLLDHHSQLLKHLVHSLLDLIRQEIRDDQNLSGQGQGLPMIAQNYED